MKTRSAVSVSSLFKEGGEGMKQKVSPVTGGVAILLLLLVMGLLAWRGSRAENGSDSEKPPGMPPGVAAEFNKRMGTVAPTGPAPAGTH